ncbi:transposase [Trichonephila clavata]|uniref:Transposase n=1 Tax=Trichonephila clavata TaxID=2740835 RepID=A0A8X6LM16_TRICU|nr:transposase [Trichonephila clavata]
MMRILFQRMNRKANKLLKIPMNFAVAGTFRENKQEIPLDLLEFRSRSVGTTMYCFDNLYKILLSYKTKRNICVVLLSTFQEKLNINEESRKPEIIEFYNATKGAVDILDQMCNNMPCSRNTCRWPLGVLYGMINISLLNAHVIYVHSRARKSEKVLSRRKFAIKLSENLTVQWMEKRLNVTTLVQSTRAIICELMKLEQTLNHRNNRKLKKKNVLFAHKSGVE